MAGASDKARFYLEQSVPELKEYERKKIFSREEVNSIAKRRSEFEHTVNSRGSLPYDFARYAEFEMNVDALRRKRVHRLGIKAPAHTGQKRIFFILDRATRKFHGDLGLWMQYIEFARKQKAHKKLSQVLTSVLRLHPHKPELWIYAAQFVIEEHGDMTEARSYMQQGLRFCKKEKRLWLEYGKLEMAYIAKITGRRHILGLEKSHEKEIYGELTDDPNADVIALPEITGEDIDPDFAQNSGVNEDVLRKLEASSVLNGAIPMAIFDAALKQFHDMEFARNFFDIICHFDDVPCRRKILDHVIDAMAKTSPQSHHTKICLVKAPVDGLEVDSPDFPPRLGESLRRLKSWPPDPNEAAGLALDAADWLVQLLKPDNLDAALATVLSGALRDCACRFEDLSAKGVVGDKARADMESLLSSVS